MEYRNRASGAAADVVIAGNASAVTIAVGESYTIDSLTIGDGAPLLEVDGLLAFGGAANFLDITSGVVFINGGTIANATIAQNGGTLQLSNATLDDVSYSGTFDVFGTFNALYVKDGLYASNGVIDLILVSGYGDAIYFLDSETINSQTIIVGADNGYLSLLDQAGTLTLCRNAVII